MTSTLTEPKVSAPSVQTVVIQLARFEALRFLRHPLTWVGVAVSMWMMWVLGGEVAPIMERDSVYLSGAMLPLAATTLLVANHATLRQRRLRDSLDSYPGGPNLRVLGVQLGAIGPVLLASVIQGTGLFYLLTGGPIGGIDWWELAVGPVMVAVFGLGGVLLGRGLPHPIVAPVTLVGLGVLQLLASPDAQIFSPTQPPPNFEWLAPWMMPSAFAPIEDLALRPSALHLGYLVALGLMIGFVSLPALGRNRPIRLTAMGLFVAVVVGVSLNLPSDPRSGFDWVDAAAAQSCATQEGIEYCAFELYQDWIPRWQATVAAVDALFPVTITKVMQRPPNIGFDEPGTLEAPGLVIANTLWDRAGATPYHRFDLALIAAHSAVGLPTTPQTRLYTEEELDSIVEQNPGYPGDLRASFEGERGAHPRSCSAMGQARAVVAVWLAASALEHGREALRDGLARLPTAILFRAGYEHFHNPPTSIGRPDAGLALELLTLPTEDVEADLESRWPEVIDPATPSSNLAACFGLAAPIYPLSDFVESPCL